MARKFCDRRRTTLTPPSDDDFLGLAFGTNSSGSTTQATAQKNPTDGDDADKPAEKKLIFKKDRQRLKN